MSVTPALVDRRDLFIDGAWVASQGGGVLEVIGAATEEPIGRAPDASPADVDRAVAAARRAFDSSPETPLDAYLLGEAIAEIGLPPGVVNLVSADRESSEYLVRHPDVDKVSFTGSTVTGGRVGALCGEQIKRCTLELGGKSAAILLADVDLAAAMQPLLGAALLNNGQACGAQTRILALAHATTRSSRRSAPPSEP